MVFGREKIKPNVDAVEVPKTKTRRSFGEFFDDMKKTIIQERQEKKSFEKKRQTYQEELSEAKEHLREKDRAAANARSEIERTQRSIQSLENDLKNYKSKAKDQSLIDRLELAKKSKEEDLKALIKEKQSLIQEIESSKKFDYQNIEDAKEEIERIENERREVIENKISQIQEKFGYTALKETQESLKESTKEIDNQIKEKRERLGERKEALALAKKYEFGSELENLSKECEEIEKEITSLQAGKEEVGKRIAKIQERLDRIEERTAKWKNLLSAEGLNKKTDKEPPSTPTPEGVSGGTPEKTSEDAEEAYRQAMGGGSAVKEILEGISETMTGIKAEALSTKRPESKPAKTPETGLSVEEAEKAVATKIANAKTVEDIKAIIKNLAEGDDIFTDENPKSNVLLAITTFDTYKSPEVLTQIPVKYGLQKKLRELILGEEELKSFGITPKEAEEMATPSKEPEKPELGLTPEEMQEVLKAAGREEKNKGKQIENAFGGVAEGIKEGAKEKLREYDERIRAILEDGIPLRIGDSVEQLKKDFKQVSGGIEWSEGIDIEKLTPKPSSPESLGEPERDTKDQTEIDSLLAEISGKKPESPEDMKIKERENNIKTASNLTNLESKVRFITLEDEGDAMLRGSLSAIESINDILSDTENTEKIPPETIQKVTEKYGIRSKLLELIPEDRKLI